MSNITKLALVASLQKICKEKPLDKITINDIVSEYEISRQTFYYHFKNIPDLIIWIYENSIQRSGNKKNKTWQKSFLSIFHWAKENKDFVLQTYNSEYRADIIKHISSSIYLQIIDEIHRTANGQIVSEDEKTFIAHFYEYAFMQTFSAWIESGMQEPENLIVSRIEILINAGISSTLQKQTTNTDETSEIAKNTKVGEIEEITEKTKNTEIVDKVAKITELTENTEKNV